MNRILKRALLPGLMAASLASATLVPAKPAAADDRILEDIGIGAATGVVTGVVTGNTNVLRNAVKGGAAGAAVNGVNGTRSRYHQKHRNAAQDVGVGAAASTITGAATRGGRVTANDAITGAAVGGAIHLIRNGK
ncbi:hypothetical protein WKK05_25300 [Nostoc sp. UHCC 0302]|jgi:hypothetical protein|uniref:hypothetical protein n=1 Tax=Nostoc sp. UHCC 0302 TaxID=3134896 RepID=UPI00311CB76B